MNDPVDTLRRLDPANDGQLPVVLLEEVLARSEAILVERESSRRMWARPLAFASAAVLAVAALLIAVPRRDPGPGATAPTARIFMKPDATSAQLAAMAQWAQRNGFEYRYHDKADAVAEYTRLFPNLPTPVNDADLPTSYDLFGQPANGAPLRTALEAANRQPGVLSVVDATAPPNTPANTPVSPPETSRADTATTAPVQAAGSRWLPGVVPSGWELDSVEASSFLSPSGVTFLSGAGLTKAAAVTVFAGVLGDIKPGTKPVTVNGRTGDIIVGPTGLISLRLQLPERWVSIETGGLTEQETLDLGATVEVEDIADATILDADQPAGMSPWERWDPTAITQQLHYLQRDSRRLAHLIVTTRPDQLATRLISLGGPLAESNGTTTVATSTGYLHETVVAGLRTAGPIGIGLLAGTDDAITLLTTASPASDTEWAATVKAARQ